VPEADSPGKKCMVGFTLHCILDRVLPQVTKYEYRQPTINIYIIGHTRALYYTRQTPLRDLCTGIIFYPNAGK